MNCFLDGGEGKVETKKKVPTLEEFKKWFEKAEGEFAQSNLYGDDWVEEKFSGEGKITIRDMTTLNEDWMRDGDDEFTCPKKAYKFCELRNWRVRVMLPNATILLDDWGMDTDYKDSSDYCEVCKKKTCNVWGQCNNKNVYICKSCSKQMKEDTKQDDILNEQISKLPKKEQIKENISKILNGKKVKN